MNKQCEIICRNIIYVSIFFYNLQNVLPCASCRNNYIEHIKKIPLTDNILCSKEQVVRWLVDIHNEVNKLNGKPIFTYEQLLRKYNKIYNVNFVSTSNIVLICLSLLLIVFIIILFFIGYKYKSKKLNN